MKSWQKYNPDWSYKLWVDNSTFRFNGKHLIRNMNYEGGGGGINEEQEKQWVLQ